MVQNLALKQHKLPSYALPYATTAAAQKLCFYFAKGLKFPTQNIITISDILKLCKHYEKDLI